MQAQNRSVNPFMMIDFRGNLLNYLAHTRWAEATDPRDKIFGILSLAKDASDLGWWVELKQDRKLRHHQIDNRPEKWVPFVVIFAQVLAAVATSKTGWKLVLWDIPIVISLVDVVSGHATICVPNDAMTEQTVAYACPSVK